MEEISKHDWVVYREKMPEWQEAYMEKLCKEYVEILTSKENASDRFWKIEGRIAKDKKKKGVSAEVSRSAVFTNILDMMMEGAITLDDLKDFSEDFQESFKRISSRW